MAGAAGKARVSVRTVTESTAPVWVTAQPGIPHAATHSTAHSLYRCPHRALPDSRHATSPRKRGPAIT
eukprot:1194709-Prymnesium_polylepis.1